MFASAFLILVAVLYRVVPVMMGVDQNGWLSNFAPLAAIALCGAIYLPRRMAVLLPLAALVVSDVVLNVFHYHRDLLTWEILPRYVALALVSALGFSLRGEATTGRVIGASIVGSLAFYFISNTGSWIADPGYAKTAGGWVMAMTSGLPGHPPTWMFYRNTLVSDVLFTGLFLLSQAVTGGGTADPKIARPALAS